MRRRHVVRAAITSVAFVIALAGFGPGTAQAACGGCFCKAGAGAEGGYACVAVKGYNRWMPWAA